ncbi:hypothetical protein X975_19937, partial [Stegodyphus mimosarum]
MLFIIKAIKTSQEKFESITYFIQILSTFFYYFNFYSNIIMLTSMRSYPPT